jgi:hypothetical protein
VADAPPDTRPGTPLTAEDERPDAARPRRDWRGEAIALAAVAVVFAVPLRGLLRAPGPPMEEGFMLVFPERVLHGDVPNKDFLHLYGPGSLWALAAAFKAFGVSLVTERLFGLAQQLAVVLGVYAIARHWNRTLAATGAVASALVIIPFGLAALAWVGAVGLGLLGVAAGIEARRRADEPSARRYAIAAGVLLGAALLFRVDLALAVALSGFALVSGLDSPRRNRALAAFGLTVVPAYLVHVAMAGVGNVWRGMVIDPVFNLRGGRSLPIPPPWSRLDGFLQRAGDLQQLSWPIPHLETSQQLFVWFFLLLAVVAFLLFQGWRGVRAAPASLHARVLLVVALFSAGIMPQALQRVDSAHFAWVGCVPFGFLPVAVYEYARSRSRRARPARVALASGLGTLALIILVIPAFTATRYTDYAFQTFGAHRNSFRIEHEGRVFYYGKEDRARAANEVIKAAAFVTQPGQRLFVGPVNLRKTPYSDAYLYYMLPKLRPGTYYIEMDPMDTESGSRLPSDLARSDIAILSRIWDDWDEPNDSRKIGSPETEQVLAARFCHVASYGGLYELYRRCR